MSLSRRALLIALGVLALMPRIGRTPFAQRLLVPFIAAFLVWQKRERLAAIRPAVHWIGLPIGLLGLAVNLAGLRLAPALLEPVGCIGVVVGLGYLLLGPAIMREIAFPCAFLLFLVPWQDLLIPLLAAPLQGFTAASATALGATTGLGAHRDGFVIRMPEMTLRVAAQCSGLNALMAFTAMSALYAFYTRAALTRRWVVFLLGIPLALLLNLVRVWVIMLSGHLFGERVAMTFFHEYSAPLLFMMLVCGLQALKARLERPSADGAQLLPGPA